MKIHEYANLSRRMDSEEFERLKSSIKSVGQLQPIITKAGAIIDGRHRLLACEELGVEPIFREAETDELLEAAIAANQVRKHDSPSQKAMNAATLTDLETEQGHPPSPGKLSLRKAAEIYGVSVWHVQKARAVLIYGSAELIEAVKAGVVAMPRDEDEINRCERVVRDIRTTVSQQTVGEVEPTVCQQTVKDEAAKEIKRLQKELKAANARERKEAEESELSKSLTDALVKIANLETKLAAVEAGSPEAAVLELAKPNVIVETDIASKRRAEAAERALEEERAARKRDAHDILQYQKSQNNLIAELQAAKGQLAQVGNARLAFEIFGRHVLTWRSDSRLILSTLKKNPGIIDLEVEKVCKEVGGNLLKVADQLADNRAAPGKAVPTGVAQISHA